MDFIYPKRADFIYMPKWWTDSTNRQNKLGAFLKLIETNIQTTTIHTRAKSSRPFVSPARGFSGFFPPPASTWKIGKRASQSRLRPVFPQLDFLPASVWFFFRSRFWPKTKSPPSQTNKCPETETSPVRSVRSLLFFGHFCTKSVFSVGGRAQKADYLRSKGCRCVFFYMYIYNSIFYFFSPRD